MAVITGTSGWSYDDWVGAFYPPHLKKDEWLGYYAKFFKTTEINSTYYTFPSKAIVSGWISKASKMPGFEYSVKLPGKITHDTLLEDVQTAIGFEESVLRPMSKAGCLGAVLIQLSPYLKLKDGDKDTGHLDRLQTLLSSLDTRNIQYAAEFRHSSWMSEGRLDSETAKLLGSHNVAVCAVDGPSMPVDIESTADHGYVRFHGRNRDIWFRKDGDMAGRMNRYDYMYNEKELEPWKARIEKAFHTSCKVRAYFNNHPRANAVKNARLFESIVEGKPVDIPATYRQSSIGNFFE